MLGSVNGGFNAIEALLQRYFDGLYRGDSGVLAEVFHPQARYICASFGEWDHLDMPQYFQRVARRPSPQSRGQLRRDRIVSIDWAGPETALAKVHCAIGERYFTDFLSLVYSGGRWQIIAKVFAYELLADGGLSDSRTVATN